jgi:hypothetical protein
MYIYTHIHTRILVFQYANRLGEWARENLGTDGGSVVIMRSECLCVHVCVCMCVWERERDEGSVVIYRKWVLMCMFMCVYVCVCMWGWRISYDISEVSACVHMCVCVCMCMCVCVWGMQHQLWYIRNECLCAHVCMCVYVHVCVWGMQDLLWLWELSAGVCMHMCICMYVCMYISCLSWPYMHIHKCRSNIPRTRNAYIRNCTYVHTYIHTYMHT